MLLILGSAGMAMSDSLAYSESLTAACAAFRRDMPGSGTLAVLGACSGEGNCTGACRLGLAVSSTPVPPQPPLRLGTCNNQVQAGKQGNRGQICVSDLPFLPEVLDQVVPLVQHY